MKYLSVAVPVPLNQFFTYFISLEQFEEHSELVGKRLLVPFGNRQVVGICVEQDTEEVDNCKQIIRILDNVRSVNNEQLSIAKWLSGYYLHSIGEVLSNILPSALRKDRNLDEITQEYWVPLHDSLPSDLTLPRKQKALYQQLQRSKPQSSQIKQSYSFSVIKALIDKHLIRKQYIEKSFNGWLSDLTIAEKMRANAQQAIAISAINNSSGFNCFLLDGVTGSGKTEVYLQVIEKCLLKQQQVLVLIPEIGLTPQTVARFESRFGQIVCAVHSGLTDNERLLAWHQARRADKAIFIGTRSSVFLPFYNLGMIIVDEEHDASFKQQDGFRYHARDLAVYRAKRLNVTLILGSATPSLETLQNANSKKYHHLVINKRAGNAAMPSQHLFNMNGQQTISGIATGLLSKIHQQLHSGNQVLLFVNRRGYAPALQCNQCGHVDTCASCDAPMTVHKQANNLQCHRCGFIKAMPENCSNCASTDLITQGVGTEQLEDFLSKYFAPYKSVRIDSDSTRSKKHFNQMLDDINNKRYQILVGTQILSKGHHFPDVTLVVMLNVDSLLFSGDFRAPERLGQLVTQLSGRAGRANKPGELWLQTRQPQHVLLQDLIQNSYSSYAKTLLIERKATGHPPFGFQVVIRAESEQIETITVFLDSVSAMLKQFSMAKTVGPMPCLVEKKQKRYRYQIITISDSRQYVISAVAQVLKALEEQKLSKRLRWHVDVQPTDLS